MNMQFIQPIEKRQLPPLNLYNFYFPAEKIWNSFSESPQAEQDDDDDLILDIEEDN